MGFKWKTNTSIFDEEFIRNYDEDSDKGYILEVTIDYPKDLHDLHSDVPFLPERVLKQALDHGLVFKKVHKVITFNQVAWLKPCMDLNTKLKTEAKNYFGKGFFKITNNSLFGKIMGNVKKHRDIKLVTTDKRRNQLVSESNYYTAK